MDLKLVSHVYVKVLQQIKTIWSFISVANEEKEKTVKSMVLTRNEVRNVKSQLKKAEFLGSGNRKPYVKWTPEQKAKIGERAHKQGILSALKHFAGEHPNLKNQTVFEFKKAYEKLKSSQQDVTKIDSRERGRPKLLPEDLMKKTIQTVQSLRLKGAPISSSIISANGKGIVIANVRMLLVENGGHLSFSDSWARNIRNEMVKRWKDAWQQHARFPWHQLCARKKNSLFNGTS